MVFFSCNACGESIKKNQVEKHYSFKCRNCEVLTCIDCQKEFRGDEYIKHIKCLTEGEKYGGKDYQPKKSAGKGEKKQENWIANIKSYIAANTLSPDIANLLTTLTQFENVPRKKQKFENFCKSSFRLFNKRQINEIWEIFNKANLSQKPTPAEVSKKTSQDYTTPQQGGDKNSNETTEYKTQVVPDTGNPDKKDAVENVDENLEDELESAKNADNDQSVLDSERDESKKNKRRKKKKMKKEMCTEEADRSCTEEQNGGSCVVGKALEHEEIVTEQMDSESQPTKKKKKAKKEKDAQNGELEYSASGVAVHKIENMTADAGKKTKLVTDQMDSERQPKKKSKRAKKENSPPAHNGELQSSGNDGVDEIENMTPVVGKESKIVTEEMDSERQPKKKSKRAKKETGAPVQNEEVENSVNDDAVHEMEIITPDANKKSKKKNRSEKGEGNLNPERDSALPKKRTGGTDDIELNNEVSETVPVKSKRSKKSRKDGTH